MAYSIERLPERISIGRETETGVTDVMIDCGAWIRKWPGMALHAIHTPESGAPYILQTETDGSVLVWHVTDADTAKPGTGLVEIVGETDGRRKVSATVKVSVAARMSGTVGEPPEAASPWVDSVLEAAGRITGMRVQAETLDAGSGARAEWDGEQGLLTIGVPKGKDGKDGADGKDAVVDATLTQSGQAADAKATRDAIGQLKDDMTALAPAGAAVGQLFRVSAISEDGKYTMEPVDMPVVPVKDVTLAGASVVKDGVADVKLYAKSFGKNDDGIYLRNANNSDINNRSANVANTCNTIDYALKAAMCDGKGAAWTSEEQAAARARMGIPGDYELIEEITLSESVDSVLRINEPDGTAYNLANAFLSVYVPKQDGGYIPGTIWVYFRDYKKFNAGRLYGNISYAIYKNVYIRAEQRTSNGIWLNAIGEFGPENIASSKMTVYNVKTENSNITGINIICSLPAGTIIQIYGVRI